MISCCIRRRRARNNIDLLVATGREDRLRGVLYDDAKWNAAATNEAGVACLVHLHSRFLPGLRRRQEYPFQFIGLHGVVTICAFSIILLSCQNDQQSFVGAKFRCLGIHFGDCFECESLAVELTLVLVCLNFLIRLRTNSVSVLSLFCSLVISSENLNL